MIAELIMRCFHARTVAHILHLGTRSFAAHKALNEFYDEIVDLVDKLAEAYQGEYGLIENYPPRFRFYADGLDLMADLAEWIPKHRHQVCDKEDTHLQNIIDEIMALVRSTQYKLRFLK